MANQNYVHPVKAILISKSRFQARTILFMAFFWIVAAIASATFCQMASAQNAKTYAQQELAEKYRVEVAPLDADADMLADIKRANRPAERSQRDDMGKVRAILTSNGNISDPVIAEYFEGYEFPSMTILDNRNSSLGAKRTKFIKDFLNDKVTGGARSGLIDLTINAMKKICPDDSLHPAARLNAVYLMGILDQTAAMRSPAQLPVPSRSAFDSLKKILDSQDNKSFPPYIKVAALAGIQRHLEVDRIVGGQVPAADKQQLLQTAYGFLDNPKNDDLTYWLKRRGMQMIGLIGSSQSLDRVVAVLNSEDAGFWLRFDALEAIGQLNLATDGMDKNMEASVAITRFVGSSLEKESKSIEATVDKLVFNQLLFQDLDLKATGTSYDNNDPAGTGMPSGQDGGRGSGPGGGKFDGGGMGMGMGMGAGGAGGPGMPGAGLGGGGGSNEPSGPTLELPVYQLNIIRRRIKALAFTGSQVLGGKTGTDGLSNKVDADGKSFISKVVKDLNDTLDKSNVGIVDLDVRKSNDEPEEENLVSVTQQLIDLCAKSGKTLSGYVRAQTGEPEAAPADAAVPVDTKPATPAAGDKPDF